MVAAVNSSLRDSGVRTKKDLLKFLIYKYLFYFDEIIMDDIQKMFIGGGGTKKLLRKKKKTRNNIFFDLYFGLSKLYKEYKRKTICALKT